METKNFNLIYKNKETQEIKNFHRDRFRHYEAEDGTTMSKSESWTHWEFQGKTIGNNRIKSFYPRSGRSCSRNAFVQARETLKQLHYANEIATSDRLGNYLDGFMDCLNIFEGRD